MEETRERQNLPKTQVFNLVILDRSGSMGCIRRAAVDGFNETLAGIRKAQEKYADTQEHFVSLVTFCGCETRHVFDKVPVGKAHPLEMGDYVPCCTTPLYDAMGFTLTALRRSVRELEDAVVVATIITDGMENASKEYGRHAIKALVEQLRGEGWTFTYMGANQDAAGVAAGMSIRNARNFAYSHEGTLGTMRKDSSTRMGFFGRLSGMKQAEAESDSAPLSAQERRRRYILMADEAFDKEEEK